ncbi:hypothetical protein Syun_017105 [Stephania yunnanensis]|uniref:Uncharacterized protein n=1 Tax=Stephania yunnanensis TaxID=152371 RepID=A0AAP0J6E7_9MAGN
MEDYLRETSKEFEVFQIEPVIVIALIEGGNEMTIDVISDKPEKPQIESEEYQPLVLVQPTTLPWTFGTPYKGDVLGDPDHLLRLNLGIGLWKKFRPGNSTLVAEVPGGGK